MRIGEHAARWSLCALAWLAALSLLDASLSQARAAATLDKVKARGVIVAGVILSGPPYGFIDPSTHQQVGFNLDLAQEIAHQLGVKLETVTVTPPNRVPFLQQGKVDFLLANMQWTEERAEILTFVPTPYEQSGGAAVVRKASGIKSWADLKGKPVCVSQGSNYTAPLAETYGALPKGYPSQPESLLALKGGNCVAAVHTGATVKLMVADHPDEWKDYEVPFDDELIPSDSVIWLRKGETDTAARLDGIIKDLYRSGWLVETAHKNKLTVSPYVLALEAKLKAAP